MKTFSIVIGLSLLILLPFSCSEKDPPVDEWIRVDPVLVDDLVASEFNRVFTSSNFVLWHAYDEAFVIARINTIEEFQEINEEETVPDFDFNTNTLVWTKITTSSLEDEVLNVDLYVNHFKEEYKLEVTTREEDSPFYLDGIFYEWKSYSKLINHYSLELEVQTSN